MASSTRRAARPAAAAAAAASLLLLCFLVPPSRAAPPPEPIDPDITCLKGNATVDLPGFKRAMTDDDMQPLYSTSLLPDIAYWSTQAQQRGHNFSVAEILQQTKRLMWSPYIGVVIVQNGLQYRFKSPSMHTFSMLRIDRFQQALQELHASGVHVPDTMLIFNAEDVPVCHRLMGCRVPIFTLFKRLHTPAAAAGSVPSSAAATGTGSATGTSTGPASEPFQDEELLLPNFNQDWDRLCFYPWAKKNATALMRASMQVSMDQESSRYILTMLSSSSAAAAQLLDAGITGKGPSKFKLSSRQMRHFLGMRKHCRWRFLLNTDGHTASSRLGHLLGHNSVVLKERSEWVEYYYRALQPGRDHVEFEPHSLLQLMQELKAPARDGEMQAIATSGQRFAFTYLHARAKALYARQAILQYNQLFTGLEDFVRQLPLDSSSYRGTSLRDLVSYLSDLTGVEL